MHKSARYDFSRRPCIDKLNRGKRKKLQKTFRSYTKQIIAKESDFIPMPRRCSWG